MAQPARLPDRLTLPARLRLLLAGFEPFDGWSANPSQDAVRRIAADPPAALDVRSVVLPVVYVDAWPAMEAQLAAHAPDVVLATGVSGTRAALAVERVAINLDDCPRPDNAGEVRAERAIVAGAPLAYPATLPVATLAQSCRARGIPAEVSLSAGAFLCNHVFYRLCHHAHTVAPAMRIGFVHVPLLPEQATARAGTDRHGLALADTVSGLRAMLDEIAGR